MKGIEEIIDECKKHHSCDGNLTKASQLFESGDELGAWKIALGTFDWLVSKEILKKEDKQEVMENAEFSATQYHKNNELSEEYQFDNSGKKSGDHIFYDDKKVILKAKSYKNV